MTASPKTKKSRLSYLGHHSYGLQNIRVRNWGEGSSVTIGSYCSFADNITIFIGGNHYWRHVSTYPFSQLFKALDSTQSSYSNGDVIIENDVWIGSGVTIMSGVKIGNGSVVAANSHIISDVRPFSIVGGNPATFIRHRFPNEIISKLEEINWWNYDIQLNPNGLLIAQLLSSTPSMATLDQLVALLT